MDGRVERGAETEVQSWLYAPHRDSGVFFNPWARFPHSTLDLLRFWLGRRPRPVARNLAVDNDGASLCRAEPGGAVTWVGHATVVVHDRDDVFVTDPHWGRLATVRRRFQPPGLPLRSIPDRSVGLVSHSHYDHLDAATVDRLPAGMQWYVPLGLAAWFRRRGRCQVVELDWWQSVRHGRWKLTCLPVQHWSKRLGHRRNRTLWCSWLLESEERSYYYGGDSGYFSGFAEFGRRFGPIDAAILPIGSYEPRWFLRYQHMCPAEAHRAFTDLRARFLVPVHWGTFQLGRESLDEPPRALRRAVAEQGGSMDRVRVLSIGERWRVE